MFTVPETDLNWYVCMQIWNTIIPGDYSFIYLCVCVFRIIILFVFVCAMYLTHILIFGFFGAFVCVNTKTSFEQLLCGFREHNNNYDGK